MLGTCRGPSAWDSAKRSWRHSEAGGAGARGPAHRLGQEPCLLDLLPRPAGRRRRPDAASSAPPVPHAQPDRHGGAHRPDRRDDQLLEPGRMGRGHRFPPAPRVDVLLSRRSGWPTSASTTRCCRPSAPSASWSWTRRTASRTGATISGPTTGASPGSCAVSPPTVPVLATTATANDRVVDDVAEQLGAGVAILRGPLARDSLSLHAIRLADQAERLAWLASALPDIPDRGSSTASPSPTPTASPTSSGPAASTPGRTTAISIHPPARRRGGPAPQRGQGAGRDHGPGHGIRQAGPGLRHPLPASRFGIAYYQQVGRAGRGIAGAAAVLLAGREDDEISEYFIDSAFPPLADQQAIVRRARSAHARSRSRRSRPYLNLSRGQIQKTLKILEIDGVVGHERGTVLPDDEPVRSGPRAGRTSDRPAAGRARADARLRRPRRLPDGVPGPCP